MSGFETQVQKDIEVTAGANVRLDFTLQVGGLAEEVDRLAGDRRWWKRETPRSRT